MNESNDVKASPVKPVEEKTQKLEKEKSTPYVNHRKSRNTMVRPLVVPEEEKPKEIPEKPKPVIDEKVNHQDIKLEIAVKLSDRHEVILERTFEALLVDIRDQSIRWTGIEEVHRLFSVADQTTVTKLNSTLGPEKIKPAKRKLDGDDLLTAPLTTFQSESKVPADMEIHNNPDIGGIEQN
jgi:hypothetical protein